MNNINRIIQKIAPLISLALAVVLIVLGIIQFSRLKTYVDGTATITRIEAVERAETDDYGNPEYDHDVYVKFTAEDGKEYEVRYDTWTDKMQVGDQIDIKYNAEEPNKGAISSSPMAAIIMLVVGVILVLASVVMIIRRLAGR